MARQNDVRLYGCVADKPQIVRKKDSSMSRASFHLAVIRSSRRSPDTPKNEEDRIMYDWPMILTIDPDMISIIEKLKEYDIVEIKGTLVQKKIKKVTRCSHCGEVNKTDGNLYFVLPKFLAKRNEGKENLTKNQATQEVLKNREISNGIILLGNLCNNPEHFTDHKNVETTTYQVATDRKYFIKEDDPSVKVDFLNVRSYGQMAANDKGCISEGSLILVDGYLHTRRYERQSVCEACEQAYTWNDNTVDVIPYYNEYLTKFITPEEFHKQEEERKAAEAEALHQSL